MTLIDTRTPLDEVSTPVISTADALKEVTTTPSNPKTPPTAKGLTVKKLKYYLDLFEEMSAIQIQLDAVYNSYHSPIITGMPHGTTPSDPTVKALHTAERLQMKLRNLQEEVDAIDERIDSIEDIRLRNIVRLHFSGGLTWAATAKQLRKNFASADSVRNYFYKNFVDDEEA